MNQKDAHFLFTHPNKLKSLKRYKKDVYLEIVNQTKFLNKNALLKSRLWHIMNNKYDIVKCKMCDKPVKWNDTTKSHKQRYRKYCSHKCMWNDSDIQKRKNKTMHERYGNKLEAIVKKTQKTNLEKYGEDYAIQTEAGELKRKSTCMERYGFNNPAKVKEFMGKRKDTNLRKFGHEHAAQSNICQEKARTTYLKNFNKSHPSHKHILDENIELLNDKNWLSEQHITNKKPAYIIGNEIGVTVSTILKKLREYKIPLQHFQHSEAEKEISTFLNSINIDFKSNDRELIKPFELDFYIPNHNLAIEYDGIYWHSELCKPNTNYHLNKTNLCKRKGIQLIHIFENEWIQNKDIVKSRISSMVGKNERIFARCCKVVRLSKQTKTKFLNQNHLQGNVGSKINFGLTYNDELVAVMVFGKPRYSKQCQFELLRFATKINTNVIGGASRLFKNFCGEFNPESVVSYGDLRYGSGKLYNKLGFKFSHNSNPNCYYFHQTDIFKLYSRIKFQKHKLINLLEKFDETTTAWENMKNNGYNRIWDCGNGVWLWTAV